MNDRARHTHRAIGAPGARGHSVDDRAGSTVNARGPYFRYRSPASTVNTSRSLLLDVRRRDGTQTPHPSVNTSQAAASSPRRGPGPTGGNGLLPDRAVEPGREVFSFVRRATPSRHVFLRRLRVDPVALAFEGIGGQRDPSTAFAGDGRRASRLATPASQSLSQGAVAGAPTSGRRSSREWRMDATAAASGAASGCCRARSREALARAHLQQDAAADPAERCAEALREADGLTQMPRPIAGVHRLFRGGPGPVTFET